MANFYKLLCNLLIAGCWALVAVGCGGGGASGVGADTTVVLQPTDDAEIAAIVVMVLVP